MATQNFLTQDFFSKKGSLTTLLFVWVLIFAGSCGHSPKNAAFHCHKNRAALDIGSGSTKLLVAKVDKCQRKILSIISEKNFAFKFKEALHLNNGRLPEEEFNKLKETLLQLKKTTLGYSLSGVATEVFRQAKNGDSFISRLSRETGISIKLINQEEEAHLSFWGAVAVTGKKPSEIVVWDIGGGSMQMTTQRKDHLFTYLGKLASVSFKNRILSYQKKKRGSPNPIGPYGALWASALAKKEAEKVDKVIKVDVKNKEVLGVGGVHYYSIRNQLKLQQDRPYALYQLDRVIKERHSWTDRQLFGSYKETEVSNLILVSGFMKGLELNTVKPVKVNLATGVLFDESLW